MSDRGGGSSTGTTFVLWAALVAALAVAARVFTAQGSESLALVWPASGAAVLWCLTARTLAARAAALGAATLVVVAVMLATGASWPIAAVVGGSGLVQTVVCVLLLERWAPRLFAPDESYRDLRTLSRGLAAVAAATLIGAVLGSGAMALAQTGVDGAGALDWWARHLTGLLLVGVVGRMCGEAVRRSRHDVAWPGRVETTALVVVTVAGYGLVFTTGAAPYVFGLVVLAVWSGARLPTWAAGMVAAACGVAALAATIVGQGPFAELATVRLAVSVTQAFVLTVLLTTLTVAVGRDERRHLAEQVEASRREAEGRAELLDAMTESMSEGITVVDDRDRIVRTNRAARRMLALTETGFRETTAEYRVFRPDGTELTPQELPVHRARVEGREVAQDLVLRDPDGTRRVLAVRAVPLTDGAGEGAVVSSLVVYRDVTEERRAHDRLSDFAEVVAHDLRNPLTSTQGWLEEAGDTLRSTRNGDGREAVGVAVDNALRSTRRMGSLIGDLLSRARTTSLDPTRVRLSGADGLLARIGVELDCADALRVHEIPDVRADRELCHQVFTNLLSNAVKYVEPRARPRVVVTGERLGEGVVVRVHDNGIGVSEEDRGLIFEKGHRAPSAAGAYDGTGLGLAICRDVVERHGGTISYEPGAEGGSVFVVVLPAA